jgi:PAS domain S-box-containing protein
MPPLNFIDNEGTAQGLYPDLIREFVRKEDWHISFVPGSWGECYDQVQSGELDIITTIGFSPQRAKVFDYNKETVADIWGRVYKRPDADFSNIAQLDGKKIAVARKDINGKNFIQTAKKLNVNPVIVEFNSHFDVFSAIQRGDVFAGVVPQHLGFREAANYDLVPSTIEFEPFSVFFAAKKGAQAQILEQMDKHLKAWKHDPESIYYKKIDYWLGGQSERQGIPKWAYIFLSMALGCFVLLVVFSVSLKREVRRRTAEIAQREARFRTLAETTKAVPWEFDLALQKFSYLGPRVEDLFGYTIESWTDMQSWADKIHPEDKSWATDFCTIETTQGEDHDLVYRAIHADGRTLWIHDIVSVQTGENGPERLYGYFVDISEQKRLQSQAIRTSQLAALGELSAGVAHEINNPINGVINYADILKLRIHDDDHKHIVDKIIREAVRVAETVKTLLAFSRDDKGAYKIHEISLLIEEPLSLMRSQLEYDGIKINKTVDEGVGDIRCNAHQIEQVLINLMSNARYALNKKYPKGDDNKKIDISVSCVQQADKPRLRIDITDYGIGISDKELPKVQTPFFTTKEVGAGTGLGLSICSDIMRLHQGSLEFESQHGQYTIATIEIPY